MKTPKEIAETYKECLEAVKDTIKPDILGTIGKLKPEDYRTMASSVMIEFNKQGYSRGRGGGGGRNYQGPVTEKQVGYIKNLVRDGGAEASDLAEQFLEANGLDSLEKLNSSQASTLIDQLKTVVK